MISRLYFYLLVLFPYLWLEGLGLPVVAAALAAHGLAITFAEQTVLRPLRAASVRQQMLLGEALKAAALGALIAWPTPIGAIAGQAVGGIGYVLTAGPDTRLLRSLASDEDTFDRVQSRTQSYMFLSMRVAGVTGVHLFTIDPALPFLATLTVTPFAVGALLVALRRTDRSAPKALDPSVTVHERPPIPGRAMFWVDYYAVTRGVRLGTYLGLLPFLFYIELKAPSSVLRRHIRLVHVTRVRRGAWRDPSRQAGRHATADDRRDSAYGGRPGRLGRGAIPAPEHRRDGPCGYRERRSSAAYA